MAVWLGLGAALRASTALISAHRFLRAAPILVPASLLALGAGGAPALAQTIWSGPGTDFNTGTNWSTGSVPMSAQTAVFQGTGPTSLSTSLNTQLAGILFNPAAPGYNLTLGQDMTLTGSVVNTSANQQTINVANGTTLFFQGTAGSGQGVNYIVDGSLVFDDNATGGNSAFTVGSQIGIRGDARTIVLGSLSAASGTLVRNFATNDITVQIGSLGTSTTFGGRFERVSGAGALTLDKVGTGTLTLAGANMLAGTTITAGTLAIANGGTLGDGAVTNNAALAFNRTDTSTFANTISGSGTVTQAGSGTTILTGDNTYAGTTTISAGTLQIGDGGATGTLGAGAVLNNASLVFNRDSLAVTSAISGTGSVTIAGSTSLSGTNSYLGGTIINSFLFVAADSALGATSGGLTFNNGFLDTTSSFTSSRAITINAGGAFFEPSIGTTLTLTGLISGAGGLGMNGPGTLVLTSGNTYLGNTVLQGGTVVIAADSAFGNAAGQLYVNGGKLQTTANVTMARNIELQSQGGSLAPDASTLLTLSGAVTGADLTMTGAGTLVLTGANTYTGLTTVSAGTLKIGNGGTTGVLGTGTIINNSTLVFERSNAFTVANIITGTGSLYKNGIGNLTLSGDSSAFGGSTQVTAGTLSVNGKLGGDLAVASGATLGGSGAIGGDVTVDGTLSAGNSPGMLTINGNLALSGSSTSLFELNSPGVVGGVGVGGNDLVKVGGALSLGGSLDARVAAAGYYRLFDYGTLTPASVFATESISSSNAGFTVASHAVRTDVPGQVNLSVLGAGQTMQFWDGNSLASDGVVDGGSGTWQSFATNWTNDTGSANGGWGGSVGVFAGTAGTVAVTGTQSFDTLQFSSDGYKLQGDALAFGGTGGGTFNVASSVTVTIASTLQDGVGSALTKVGSGTLVLSGTNSYSGDTTLLGGVVSVERDANLGAASGALSFNGGVLQVTGTGMTSTARAINWGTNGGGFDIANAGNSFTLGQTIAGVGSLTKRGAGTLVLNGANAYGNTIVEAGTLVGHTGSISGNIGIAAGASGIFDETANASFAGDIGGLNGGKGAMRKLGTGTLTLAGASTLDWAVVNGGLVSAAERFGGNASIASGASLTFTQGGNGIYAGTLSGAGRFAKSGTGTATLTGDSSAFAGATIIADGTLIVGQGGTGKLGGTLEVLAGGTLGGSGTVGTTTLASGSTLATGNSIGTLTVDGDLIFAAGARFAVEVAPGGTASDLVAVTGTATINGGNVAHIGMTGSYDPTRTYTILTAAGGVGGTFDAVTSDFAFLDASLSYSANAVMLTLARNDTDFAAVAITRNQIATAAGLGGLTLGNALYDSIVQLDDATARTAFDQLSGELHASVTTGLITDSDHLRRAVNDRLRAAFQGVHATASPVSGGTSLVPAVQDGIAVWSTALGARGSINSDGNATSTGHVMGGLIAGADVWVVDQIRLGLLGGYSQSSLNAPERASTATIGSYHLGIYGGTQWDMPQGSLALRGGLAYSWHDLDTSRTVGFTGFGDRLSASYNASTIQAFGELGYSIETELARFEPFVNLAHVAVRTGSFAEDGGTAALIGTAGSNALTFTTVGVRVETDFDLGNVSGRFDAMLGWRRAFGDVMPQSTHGFAGTDAFTIAGSPIGRDALVLDAGLNFDLTPDATFGLSYQGQFASGAQEHGFKANLAIKF